MHLNTVKYTFEEDKDKWIETGCPAMILCVLLSLFIPSFLSVDYIRNMLGNNITFRIILSLIPMQLAFAIPLFCTAIFSCKEINLLVKLKITGWKFSYITEAIIWEAVLIVPLVVLAAIVYSICMSFGYNFLSPVTELISKANIYGIGLIFIFAVFVSPIIEEIAFRRVLFVFMTRIFGLLSSVILTSLIFAFMHGGIVQALPLFILSLVLQYLYLKHGTLIPSILLHCIHNFIIMLLFLVLKTY